MRKNMSKEQNKFGHLIDEATKTPRTDKAVFVANLNYEVVDADFARQLETELAAALGEIRGLRQLVNDCHIVAGQLETERNEARAEIEQLKTELREISDSCSKSNLDVVMMAMLKRTTLAIKYITDGTIQSNSMLNVLSIESAELMKKIKETRGKKELNFKEKL